MFSREWQKKTGGTSRPLKNVPKSRTGSGFLHRTHDRTDDRGENATTGSTANGIAKKAGQRARVTAKAAKQRTATDTTNNTADDLHRMAHRRFLDDSTDSLATDDTGDCLNNNRK
jgi:hypothetical protein